MDVKTVCLGVLSMGDASGYEIKKQFEEGPFAHFYAAGFGSIYPALNRLTEGGLVTCTAMVQEKRPAKKVYSLTPAGRLALVNAISAPPARDSLRSDFLFILTFAHLLSLSHVERLLEDRLVWCRKAIAAMEDRACGQAAPDPGRRFVHGLGLALYRAMADYIETHGHELVGEIALSEEKVAQS